MDREGGERMILIKSGLVYTATGSKEADVLVDGDRIVDVRTNLSSDEALLLDARGCLVGPGFVDVHVHLRDPGQTWKEDIETGSKTAAAGGYTAVVAMPNTDPPIDEPKVVSDVLQRGMAAGLVDVSSSAALTLGRTGVVLSDIEGLYSAGVRLFTDDGDSVADPRLLEKAMRRVVHLDGAVISQHAEDAEMTRQGHLHEGRVSASVGIEGLPVEAEVSVVERDLGLVKKTGARYHCQHVSSAETVHLIRRAKADGLPVSAEVTPHHLWFTERDVAGLDTNFKMYPPLRTPSDREALRRALADGTIDMVATDHAPHTMEEKDVPFEDAPRGVIGLETSATVAWNVLGEPERFFEVMSVAPAALASLAGQGSPIRAGGLANVVVFDPGVEWTYRTSSSKSVNSPFMGKTLRGRVVTTIHEGEFSHRRGGDQ